MGVRIKVRNLNTGVLAAKRDRIENGIEKKKKMERFFTIIQLNDKQQQQQPK